MFKKLHYPFFFLLTEYPVSPKWSRLEIEVSKDAARASLCGSPCNGLRSWMLQPICKFHSGQGSNTGAGTPAGAPILLDQSNLVKKLHYPPFYKYFIP